MLYAAVILSILIFTNYYYSTALNFIIYLFVLVLEDTLNNNNKKKRKRKGIFLSTCTLGKGLRNTMDDELKEVERLKVCGNDHFSRGKISDAISTYHKALDLAEAIYKKVEVKHDSDSSEKKSEHEEERRSLPSTEVIPAVLSLRCALFSNLSNLFLSQKNFQRSWEAAASAIQLAPHAIKPWMRYVDARRQGGFPFDAFVTLLQYVRPLVRKHCAESLLSSAQASSILGRIESALFRDLGLSEVHEGLELIKHLNGMALVTRQPLKANEVLLVEKKFITLLEDDDNWDEDGEKSGNRSNLSDPEEKSTLDKVSRYAKRLRPHQESLSEEWLRFQAQMKGAWPRNLAEDITPQMKDEVYPSLRSEYPDLDESTFLELMHSALICRFNGFRDGFFRACALANHSCLANAAMKYRPDTQSVSLQAVHNIPANEAIHVKYLSDAHFLMGVGKRREYLHSWLFWCQCSRCTQDQREDADVEKIACPSCNAYVFHPFTPNPTIKDELLLDMCATPCNSCGASLQNWGEINAPIVRHLLTNVTRSVQMTSTPQLGKWFRETLEEIVLLKVHPCHWLYRVLFYFYCSAVACHLLPSIFGELKTRSLSRDGVATLFQANGVQEIYIQQVLRGYVVSAITNAEGENSSPSTADKKNGIATLSVLKSLSEEGSDILNALIILWYHISSFYPPYELWAAHKAICQLVLLHLIYQDEKTTKNVVKVYYALEILRRHSKYLGVDEGVELMHFFTEHKQFAVDPKTLPALPKLKKIFRY